MIATFSININLVSEMAIQQTYLYHSSVVKGFDNGVCTGMILIDLQKALDTVNHKILLDKLLPIGFSNNTISWYESYLAERHFTAEVANRVSKFHIQNTTFLWYSVRFNFRPSTVFDFCQRYEPSYRMRLVPICRRFLPALPAYEYH